MPTVRVEIHFSNQLIFESYFVMSLSSSFRVQSVLALFQLSIKTQGLNPDKSPSNDIPCVSSGTDFSCCHSDSYCLSNGLYLTNLVLFRGSYTDKSWQSP